MEGTISQLNSFNNYGKLSLNTSLKDATFHDLKKLFSQFVTGGWKGLKISTSRDRASIHIYETLIKY